MIAAFLVIVPLIKRMTSAMISLWNPEHSELRLPPNGTFIESKKTKQTKKKIQSFRGAFCKLSNGRSGACQPLYSDVSLQQTGRWKAKKSRSSGGRGSCWSQSQVRLRIPYTLSLAALQATFSHKGSMKTLFNSSREPDCIGLPFPSWLKYKSHKNVKMKYM